MSIICKTLHRICWGLKLWRQGYNNLPILKISRNHLLPWMKKWWHRPKRLRRMVVWIRVRRIKDQLPLDREVIRKGRIRLQLQFMEANLSNQKHQQFQWLSNINVETINLGRGPGPQESDRLIAQSVNLQPMPMPSQRLQSALAKQNIATHLVSILVKFHKHHALKLPMQLMSSELIQLGRSTHCMKRRRDARNWTKQWVTCLSPN